jgi:pimeloyl-ACP methyl ester carboxylesterase
VKEQLNDIGHWTQQEAPDQVNKILLDFLEKI